MNTKEKVIEALEGKRTEAVWELIEKAVNKVYRGKAKYWRDLSVAKKEYLEAEEEVNNQESRYIIFEDYNLAEGFFCRFYEDGYNFGEMFEDYFSDTGGGGEEILCVDMKKMKCYLIGKEVKFNKEEIKIK